MAQGANGGRARESEGERGRARAIGREARGKESERVRQRKYQQIVESQCESHLPASEKLLNSVCDRGDRAVRS